MLPILKYFLQITTLWVVFFFLSKYMGPIPRHKPTRNFIQYLNYKYVTKVNVGIKHIEI